MKPKPKNPAAQALARLSRLNPTEAQKAASRANGLLGAEHGAKGGRPPKKMEDYDVWYKPCANCGFDPGQTKNDRCWKCGRRVYRDFSDRALKAAKKKGRK